MIPASNSPLDVDLNEKFEILYNRIETSRKFLNNYYEICQDICKEFDDLSTQIKNKEINIEEENNSQSVLKKINSIIERYEPNTGQIATHFRAATMIRDNMIQINQKLSENRLNKKNLTIEGKSINLSETIEKVVGCIDEIFEKIDLIQKQLHENIQNLNSLIGKVTQSKRQLSNRMSEKK